MLIGAVFKNSVLVVVLVVVPHENPVGCCLKFWLIVLLLMINVVIVVFVIVVVICCCFVIFDVVDIIVFVVRRGCPNHITGSGVDGTVLRRSDLANPVQTVGRLRSRVQISSFPVLFKEILASGMLLLTFVFSFVLQKRVGSTSC